MMSGYGGSAHSGVPRLSAGYFAQNPPAECYGESQILTVPAVWRALANGSGGRWQRCRSVAIAWAGSVILGSSQADYDAIRKEHSGAGNAPVGIGF